MKINNPEKNVSADKIWTNKADVITVETFSKSIKL